MLAGDRRKFRNVAIRMKDKRPLVFFKNLKPSEIDTEILCDFKKQLETCFEENVDLINYRKASPVHWKNGKIVKAPIF